MTVALRPYKHLFPQLGLRVMVDPTSVVAGRNHGRRCRYLASGGYSW